ncbi:MAG: dUTP diphosphatase [Ruminococcaceae bacterium]|nr:dUTP diphosphatase [Oscillospiraceae bacterium]
MEINLKIKKMREGAVIPSRATSGSAGMDLCACIDAPVTLEPLARAVIPSGIAIELPDSGCVAYICARSGLGIKHGITLSNSIGVIDSDYRGEIAVGLVNLSDKAYTIAPGERIAQMIISPVLLPVIEEVTDLGDTERGSGGFGSTGKL